jgi:hypothetical protein
MQEDTFTRCTNIAPQQEMWFGRRLVLAQQLSHTLWTGHHTSGTTRHVHAQSKPVLAVQVVTAAEDASQVTSFHWQGAAILTGEATPTLHSIQCLLVMGDA